MWLLDIFVEMNGSNCVLCWYVYVLRFVGLRLRVMNILLIVLILLLSVGIDVYSDFGSFCVSVFLRLYLLIVVLKFVRLILLLMVGIV